MAKKEFDKEKWQQEQAEKTKEMGMQIKELAMNFQNRPEDIAEYLNFASKHYSYSPRNSMLIYTQNRGATFCGSYLYWKEQLCSVQKGEKGLKIFVPVTTTFFRETSKNDWKQLSSASKTQKEKIKAGIYETMKKNGFKIGTVFDISQTNYPTEDYPKLLHVGFKNEQHSAIFSSLSKYSAEKLNCPVKIENVKSISLHGFYAFDENAITISDKLEDTNKLSTLSHEIGHAIMHKADDNITIVQKELEADAYSIMIQSYIGLDLTEERKSHLAGHYKDMIQHNKSDLKNQIEFEDVLKNVTKTFSETIEDISGYISRGLTSSLPTKLTKSQNDKINISEIKRLVNEKAGKQGKSDYEKLENRGR